MDTKLKNIRILITAGPTCVAIDKVRVITNIATGETGILLAKKARKLGAQVSLFLGYSKSICLDRSVKLYTFKFFNQLRDALRKELARKKYDIIIHSAAVSDFKPAKQSQGKVASGKSFNLRLVPLPKIIKDIRRLNPKAKLVMFKLESALTDKALINRARSAMKKSKAQVCVANQLNPYRAYILSEQGKAVRIRSKKDLVNKLFKVVES